MRGVGCREGRRIALFLPDLTEGGAERTMVELAQGFVRRGVQVDFVLASAHGGFLAELPATVRVIDLNSTSVIGGLPTLVSYLRRERPEAVLASLPHASIVLVWAKLLSFTGVPVYLREATTPSAVSLEDRGNRFKDRLMPLAMEFFYPMANGVVAVSRGVARDLHDSVRVPRRKLVTIYNPVVTPELLKGAVAPVEHPWFAPGEPPVILSVGRLRKEKDFETLVRAFALLRARTLARLVILGEGEERARLERLVEEFGLQDSVSLPGFVPNPFAYMSRAAAYVLSSRREGLPGALIQAMACGCPVVSTDCPSGPEEVLEGGRYGPLVPVGNPGALASAVEGVLRNPVPAECLKERARIFSADESVEQYLSLLLQRRKPLREGAPA